MTETPKDRHRRREGTAWMGQTEYDVVRLSRLHVYVSDDAGRRFHGPTVRLAMLAARLFGGTR